MAGPTVGAVVGIVVADWVMTMGGQTTAPG
jgi:hypothetical protein